MQIHVSKISTHCRLYEHLLQAARARSWLRRWTYVSRFRGY